MMQDTVVMAPDPVLRIQCAPIEAFEASLGDGALRMLNVMYRAKGRGLAAPQVGWSRRIFVMDAGWKDGLPSPMVFINPEIADASEARATQDEQCLSIPDHPVSVTRPTWILLRWQGLDGGARERRFDGFEAACIQHERDHLDGVLITDYEGAA